MKLLINASTLSGTGVSQVAVSFISECKKHSEHEYTVFLSKSIYDNIDIESFPNNFTFFKFINSPLKSLSSWVRCKYLYIKTSPNCVFSIFGPSYWTPNVPHLQGYAYPHYVYPESPLFNIISFKEKFKIMIYKHLHKYFLKRNGNYFVAETVDVSHRLKKFLGIDSKNIFTVSNTYNREIFKKNTCYRPYDSNEFKLLSLCSPYLHKNLSIINQVVEELEKLEPKLKFTFILTIDSRNYNSMFSNKAKRYIRNVGPVAIKDCPDLYRECDAIFLPTLLECFSANYPEAMVMERPILTSDLPFARCVCKDAALYFNPMDPKDIATKLIALSESRPLYKSLVSKGLNVLADIPSSSSRALQYLSICESISKK